ncbi:hypothetical protein B566_EDAN017124 [Ephemera danica]|nr:hypothetical protein B566_EDAN017124 [Ephemera danica]
MNLIIKMRRVSGKNNKRRKTDDPETSDVEENTEENGNTEAKDDDGEEQAETSTDAVEENAEEDAAEPEEKSPKKSPKKKGKATKKAGGRKAAKSKKPADEEEEEEYEVEAVVDSRYMRGKRQFKVRWRGHGPEEDSWCGEADLHCPLLIQEYTDSVEDSAGESSSGNKKGRKRKSASKDDEDDEDEEKEYERVLEVKFKKNGKREFLIRWKGFSSTSDTWEPEENLNCTDLINKLLEKVEKAKESSDHELRTKPKQTSRLTYRDPTIRTSGRKRGNARKTYHDLLE